MCRRKALEFKYVTLGFSYSSQMHYFKVDVHEDWVDWRPTTRLELVQRKSWKQNGMMMHRLQFAYTGPDHATFTLMTFPQVLLLKYILGTCSTQVLQ